MSKVAKKSLVALITAAALLVTLTTGCSKTDSKGSSENSTVSVKADGKTAKLKLINYGDSTPRRQEYLDKDLHDVLLKELNVDLSLEFLPWGSKNAQLMLASGEDIATFAGTGIGGFQEAVAKDLLAELPKEKIDKLMPDYLKVRAPYGFELSTINGKIYGIPLGNKPYSGSMQTLMCRQDLLDEAGIKSITNYDELKKAMAAVHAKHPDYTMVTELSAQKLYLRKVINSSQLMDYIDDYLYVDVTAKDDKVYSWYESEAFKNLYGIHKEWKDLGYIDANMLVNSSQYLANWKAGKAFAYAGSPARPMEETPIIKKSVPNVKLNLYKIGDIPNFYAENYNTSYAISAATKNLDKYLELFNWMYKNQENYDLLAYGVKDKDYKLQGDKVEKLVSDTFFDEWQIFNIKYGRYNVDVSDDFIKQYKETDKGVIKSKKMGFIFDKSSLSNEVAKMSAIVKEKVLPIQHGFIDYNKNYPAVIAELKAAGLDKYVAECQKQFTAWYAKNK